MRSPMLMLLPAVLMAQRSALPPMEAFDRELKRNRLGTWLVLEDEGAFWGAALQVALLEEPLVALNLPLKVVAGGKKVDALAAGLRARYSWSKGAHWALVDGAGRILVERATQPTAATVANAAEQTGVRSRAEELEAFLRQNPDHLEAQLALLRERVDVANRRTLKLVGVVEDKPAGTPPVPPEPPRKLDADSDQRIWSSAAQQLDRIFQGPWQEAGLDLATSLRISLAEHSPMMAALLTRYRGALEEPLRRRPNGVEPWMMWLSASRKAGGWPLAPLLQSMQPLPGTTPGEWPPMMVLSEFVKEAKARADWPAIREALEPRWEDLKAGGFRWGGGSGLWGLVIGPLVEAYLSTGDVSAAEQLLNEVNEIAGWPGLPTQARDLATRLNRPDLAARWGALTPKGR